jgi:hypothetical protein
MTDSLVAALKELGVTPENIAELMAQKIVERGIPQKVLLTPQEAAWALGFSERAFEQSEWHREIPVVKIGIKNLYRHRDLEDFAANRMMQPLRRLPMRARRAA